MTTIAWDGVRLASDSLGDQNGLRMPLTKLHRGILADKTPFIVGCAGETSWSRQAFQWIKTLTVKTIETTPYPHQVNEGPDRNDPHVILVVEGRFVYYKVGLMLVRLEREFHAVGSGRDFAIAAMALGKNAKEAVQLACEFDCYSAGPVRTMEYKVLK